LSNTAESGSSLGVAVLGNLMYCVHTGSGNNHHLWWCTFDPTTLKWSADQEFAGGNRCADSPSVANYLGRLFCVHRGDDSTQLWWLTFDPSTQQWSVNQPIPGAAAAIISWNNILWCVYPDNEYLACVILWWSMVLAEAVSERKHGRRSPSFVCAERKIVLRSSRPRQQRGPLVVPVPRRPSRWADELECR